MRIAINGTSCLLLKDLLLQHRDGQSRILWKTYDYKLPAKYRTDAAAPLLNQLNGESRFLCINGDQRDLLLRLLAWMAISNRSWDELVPVKGLLARLQPQGTPLEAEVGDFVVIKQSGVLVEIVHFNGGEGNFVTNTSTGFIVCETHAPPEGVEQQYIDCDLGDLMWPSRMSVEAIIWGPYPHRLAA